MSETLLERRNRLLGPNLPTFYDEPVHLVRGEGVWVWDADGNRYLDCYNNVPHVGHCHPDVVDAICEQAGRLNTHTRYLHETIVEYAERLTDKFADPLSKLILTCTGSEANDIALRIAEAVTGKSGVIATDHTYHGNTTAVAALSTTNAPPEQSTSRVQHVSAPDSYRPPAQNHAEAFAEDIARAIHELDEAGCGFAALIVCPFFANEGFPALEPGFLDPALEIVRAAGGLLICDEVQCGFGRIGSHMWGHERMKCAPDIVTLGKPMANGHPVGGVVTTPEYMTAFRSSYRYFNTFGGNPVSCAAALATLDVLEREDLAANADRVGAYARDGLARLAGDHHCIGDVRGSGLFFGAEMVLDRETRAPAREFVNRVTNAMRQRGVLLNRLGIHYNTLKIRPPMPFSTEHADILLATLDDVLRETALVG